MDAPELLHEHTRRCWWDADSAHWNCPAGAVEPADERDRPLVDVRDMLVVHTALLREFRLAPAVVARASLAAGRSVDVADRHLGLLCDLLHHHHAGEDALLWPLLRARLPETAALLVDTVEAQHAALDESLHRVTAARSCWRDRRDAASRDALVDELRTLHSLLSEHLDAEERTVLPVAATVLTEAEWHAIGEAAVAAMPKSTLPLTFGMFAYEGDPEVVKDMLRTAPPLPRLLLPRIAPRVYARRATQIHGTARP
jgi:iron-sulfur cluster repair protein YtfE (RIC family)